MYSTLAIVLIVITFTHAIDWNGNNWALNCDFSGNDLTNVQCRGEDCGGRCASTPGCTHFTWTNYNGGTCWMKKNGASKNDAFPKYDSGAVCGVISSSGGSAPSPVGNVLKGRSTRYWDCCKPSCSWSGKASVTKPVSSCSWDGASVLFDSNVQSGCGGGGAFTCNNNQPWAINDNLSYGFAAARMAGKTEADLCCKCFQWTFTSGPVVGKKMVIQVTNTGEDLNSAENHFDLQIPGGGVGIFNGCSAQWGAPGEGWGARYGGVSSEQQCDQLPWQIRDGCKWRFQWFKNADNPTFDLVEVQCPQELISRSGCSRR